MFFANRTLDVFETVHANFDIFFLKLQYRFAVGTCFLMRYVSQNLDHIFLLLSYHSKRYCCYKDNMRDGLVPPLFAIVFIFPSPYQQFLPCFLMFAYLFMVTSLLQQGMKEMI